MLECWTNNTGALGDIFRRSMREPRISGIDVSGQKADLKGSDISATATADYW